MSSPQIQDLILYDDNSLIPDSVLNSLSSYLSVISHLQGTSPIWLITSLIENSINGTASLVNKDLNLKVPNRSRVFFVSFMKPKDFYVKSSKKNGIDLSITPNFEFIDCFSDLYTKQIPDPANASSLVCSVFESIISTIEKSAATKKIVFIESPELLLFSTNIDSSVLLSYLNRINKLCRQLFVIIPQDSPLIDWSSANKQDPVFKFADFLSKLYHRSNINLNLQPLSTGRAKDITGCLTIAKGSLPYDIKLKVLEKEYVYHVSKESSVKLFFR